MTVDVAVSAPVADDAALQEALSTLGGLIVGDDGRPFAATATAFQWELASALLSRDVLKAWWEGPRGARKTTTLAAVLMALLVHQAPRGSRSFIGAEDQDQAAELIDAAASILEATPELGQLLRVRGLDITNRVTGAKVTALPGDPSAMGKRPYLIVVDELSNWPDTRRHRRFWTALQSATRKNRECRFVVLSNAGWQDSWQWVRREVARTSPLWWFRSVPGPMPWLTAQDLESLREDTIDPADFDRLHLNRWVPAAGRLATLEELEELAVLEEPLAPRFRWGYVIGVDLATQRDNAVCVVAHYEPAGEVWDPLQMTRHFNERWRIVVDRVQVWSPPVSLTEVEGWLQAVGHRYAAKIVMDPTEGRGIAERLSSMGRSVRIYQFTSASVGPLAVLLQNLIREKNLALPAYDPELLEELAAVRIRRNAFGSPRLDHESGKHDDRAVAIALAASELVAPPAEKAPHQVLMAGRWALGRR